MLRVKRWLSFLLAFVMLFSALPLNAQAEEITEFEAAVTTEAGQVEQAAEAVSQVPPEAHAAAQAEAAGDIPVTRAQWLQMLVETFDYVIDGDIIPDNYFPDLSAEAEYYNAVMTAVYYGLVDVLPNSELRPEEAATREFAAYTLNACMGYLPDAAEYEFSEAASVTYADDIQVAIERGWFALVDGAFLPEQVITLEERALMLADAQSYIADMAIDQSHDNQYTFKEGIVVIEDEAQILQEENGSVIVIPNLTQALAAGDHFVVFQDGLAIPYEAADVTVADGQTRISAEDLYFEDAIETMNVQLETDADVANFYAAEDAELIFIEESTGQEYSQQAAIQAVTKGSKSIYIPKYSKSFEIGSGVTVSLNVELKNAKLCHNVDIGVTKASAAVWLDTDAEVSAKLSCSLADMVGDGFEVYIGGYEVPGVGGLAVYVKMDVSGSISVVKKLHMKVGVKVGFDALKWKPTSGKIFKVTDKGSTMNAEISAKICLEAKFGVYGKSLPLKGYLYGEAGFKANVKYTEYLEIIGNCTHFAAFLYAEYGAKIEWGLLGYQSGFDWNKEMIKEENSPVKISIHYEDGKQVDKCTRTELEGTSSGSPSKIGDSGYTTSSGSPYSGSGLSRGSSTGSSASGEPIIIYEYTLDDADYATLTKYSGTASSLSVPSTIDGYPVVAIGSDAFEGCTGLTSVILPDSVTQIGSGAFRNCSSLKRIELPAKLEFLDEEAFANCRSLSYIKIPKTLTQADAWYGRADYGIFYGCTSLKTVTLEKGMTVVAPYLFCGAPAIETITIPDTVTEIGSYAFAHAGGLKNIVLPDSVVTIDSCAFLDCTGLETVTFSQNLTALNSAAFEGCTVLDKVELPDSLKEIQDSVFKGCTNLTQVKLPAALEFLNEEAFINCTSLTEITIPKTLTQAYAWNGRADNGIFYGCTALTNVTLEEGMTIVAPYLFCGAPAIETITVPDTVTEIGSHAFAHAGGLKSIVLPDSILTIDSHAFLDCTGLETVTFSQNLTTLNTSAFEGCTVLDKVELPDSLKEIQDSVFQGCTNLAQVKLPAALEFLNEEAFANCTSLTEITIPKTLTQADAWNGRADHGIFYGCTALTNVTLEEGMTIVAPYLFCGAPAIETITIPDTVTEIGSHAFDHAGGLKSIVLPDSILTIDSHAFLDCTGLETVTFSQNLTTLNTSAFEGCTVLPKVELPDSLKEIQDSVFKGCTNLAQVKLPAALEFLNEGAFINCTSLTEITIPKTLTQAYAWYGRASDGIFYGCTALTNVTLEEGMTIVAPYLFCGAPAIETITIPDTVTEIGSYAFAYAGGLKNIVLPDSILTINSCAFLDCTGLETVQLPRQLISLGSHAFENCSSLQQITVSEGVTTIGESTFANCAAMTVAVLPDSVTLIDECAFQNSGLTVLELPAGLQRIERYAFANNDFLTEVVLPGGVTYLGTHCFNDCDVLERVVVPNSVTKMETYCFNSCDLLMDVTLGLGLTEIPSYAFSNCPELVEIVIPYYVANIDSYAFKSSAKLTRVVVRKKLASIGTEAFSYPAKTVFYGPVGSYAETWCAENGFAFHENTTVATAVTVAEKTISIPKNQSRLLDITVEPADFSDSIVFKSSNTAVATVDEAGKLTAVAPGTTTIKILVGSASASCKVTVTQAVTRLTLDKDTLDLEVPNTYQLKATITPTDATNQILSWTSSNESAATVDENGLITAVGNGTAIITAATTDGSNLSASCTVTVTDPFHVLVGSITLDQTELSLEALESCTLTAVVDPENAANKALIWTSSDEQVATVDEFGVVTAAAKGTATITATAADESGVSAVCTVTVTNNAYVVTDVAQLESAHNYSASCTDFWLYTVPQAEALYVTFDPNTEMEEDFDFLLIFSGSGELVGSYTGTELAGQTITVPGDTVKIQLNTDDSGNEWGFKVAEITVKEHTHDYVNGVCTICGHVLAQKVASGWSGATEWTLMDDGTLTVYGIGNMKNYGYNGGQPWLNKGVDITSVIIEEGVASVGSGAFMNLTTLESVVLPETLTKMGEAAFYGSGLTSVEIPASLWTIQPYTFKNCANLTKVTFQEGNLQKISDGAFYGTGLTELVLPDCLRILDIYAFKGCSKLTNITIGSGLTELREAVFYGTAIPTITVPEGITKIGSYAFKNCVKLETIDLPSTLQSVGEASFYACTALKAVELPDKVTAIGNYAFRKCAAIETLKLSTELVTVGECAFYGCTGLTELVIPDKVTTIKPYAFKTCTGLTSVTLGDKVATIGEGAFNTCTGLKTIVFPASLTSIGNYCFSGSTSLWKLTFEGNAPAIGTGAFKGLNAYAYYPTGNSTYTSANMLNYGGKITWKAN